MLLSSLHTQSLLSELVRRTTAHRAIQLRPRLWPAYFPCGNRAQFSYTAGALGVQVRANNLQELVYKQGQAGVTKASVSIVFSNADKANSPVGYEQHDQITVTRQVRNRVPWLLSRAACCRGLLHRARGLQALSSRADKSVCVRGSW